MYASIYTNPAYSLCFIYSEDNEIHQSTAVLKIFKWKMLKRLKNCEFASSVFPPQAWNLLQTCWNLLSAVASQACSAPQRQRHWKITLGSHCSRATTAVALLGQNQAWCFFDSTSLGLILPYCVLACIRHTSRQVAEREPFSNGFNLSLLWNNISVQE